MLDANSVIVIVGFLAFFGALVYFMVSSGRKTKARKAEVARSLGFTPIELDVILADKVIHLYQNNLGKNHYEMRNLSVKIMPDGKMYLFDLVETSGEHESHTEDQAVAIQSSYLNLPVFYLYPQPDLKGAAMKFAGQILQWVVSKTGTPVDFPDHPEFQQRFLVVSPDPEETRNFLDANKRSLLAHARLWGVRAGGDLFTLSKFDQFGQQNTNETLAERINQALDVFQIFTR